VTVAGTQCSAEPGSTTDVEASAPTSNRTRARSGAASNARRPMAAQSGAQAGFCSRRSRSLVSRSSLGKSSARAGATGAASSDASTMRAAVAVAGGGAPKRRRDESPRRPPSRRKISVANALMARTSVSATGVDNWNAEDFTDAFTVYMRGVVELAKDQKAKGDERAAQAAYGLLLDDQLDVRGVVDARVVTEYAKLLAEYRSSLPPSAAEKVDERLRAVDFRRRTIEAVLKAADYQATTGRRR